MKVENFSFYPINKYKYYGGKMAKKECIIIDGQNYMLKYAPRKDILRGKGAYRNDPVAEYIGCHVYEMVNIPVQKTLLGYKNDILAVACEDFEKDGYRLSPFQLFKNGCMSDEQAGFSTEISSILETIHSQEVLDGPTIENRFWDMLVVDALLANPDRHNENWGFLINENEMSIKLAPVFDCGYSLFVYEMPEKYSDILSDKALVAKITNGYPPSLITDNGEPVNFKTLLLSGKYEQLNEAILRIAPQFNLDKINALISNIPVLSEVEKTFYKVVFKGRMNNIILPALEFAQYKGKTNFNVGRIFGEKKKDNIAKEDDQAFKKQNEER